MKLIKSTVIAGNKNDAKLMIKLRYYIKKQVIARSPACGTMKQSFNPV